MSGVKPTVGQARMAGRVLAAAREAAGLTQEALGRAVGAAARTVRSWESGERAMPEHRVVALSRLLGVPAERLRWSSYPPEGEPVPEGEATEEPEQSALRLIPRYVGPVRAGRPIEAGADVEGQEATTHPRVEWAVRVVGDSMVGAGLEEGDVVLCRSVHSPDQVRNGDIVVALVDGEVTVKRLVRTPSGAVLRADPPRPDYPDIPCRDGVVVQGVVLEVHKPASSLVRPPAAATASAPRPGTPDAEWRRILDQLTQAAALQAQANLEHAKAVEESASAARMALRALLAARLRRRRRGAQP